jgi:predicted phage tail protein
LFGECHDSEYDNHSAGPIGARIQPGARDHPGAFGVFNLVSGVALLAASVIAGGLWTLLGPAMTFYAGAMFSSIALLGLSVRR